MCQSLHRLAAGLAFVCNLFLAVSTRAQQVDIHGPLGSGAFGAAVAVLPNGNFVVTDPDGPVSNVGVVYLYSPAGTLISSFTGSAANDHVGSGGISVLPSGNFVISSPDWANGAALNAGAVTWVNGTVGLSGVVSSSNSLVGSTAGDSVGSSIYVLKNGKFVVASSFWANGTVTLAGAVTWIDGSTGLSGPVSALNSSVGATQDDFVGEEGIVELTNGNYVVPSSSWQNSAGACRSPVTCFT